MIESQKTVLQETLLQRYQALSPVAQRILQVRALVFYSKRKTDFIDCLASLHLKTEDGKKLYQKTLAPIFQDLITQGFLIPDYHCRPEIVHTLAQVAVDPQNPYAQENLAAAKRLLNTAIYDVAIQKLERSLLLVHLAIHTNDITLFIDPKLEKDDYYQYFIQIIGELVYSSYLDFTWVKTRDPVIQAFLCVTKLSYFYYNMRELPPDYQGWCDFYAKNNFIELVSLHAFSSFQSYLLQIEISMGLLERVKEKCGLFSEKKYYQQEALGLLAFFQGHYEIALRYYENAIKLYGRASEKKVWLHENIHGLFYILLLIQQKDYSKAENTILMIRKNHYKKTTADVLEAILRFEQGEHFKAEHLWKEVDSVAEQSPVAMPILQIFLYWIKGLLHSDSVKEMRKAYQKAFIFYENMPHRIAAQFYAENILLDDPNDVPSLSFLQKYALGPFRFLDFFKVKQAWEYAIDQLQRVIVTKSKNVKTEALQEKRLAWRLDPKELQIEAVEQKYRKNGTWTEGKAVALKRLYQLDPKLSYLTEQDKAAIEGLHRETVGWYHQENYYWEPRKTLLTLIGHPLIFHKENPQVHIELAKGELGLHIEKLENGYHLSLSHHASSEGVRLEPETANRYHVIDFTADTLRMSQIISEAGMTVPLTAKEKVIEIIEHAKSDIHIHSEIDEDSIPSVASDSTCCVHLLPIREGLKLTLWVRPFKEVGPYCRIGEGQSNIIALIPVNGSEVKQKAIRDLNQENQQKQRLLNECTTLLELDTQTDEWYFDSIETCLEVLLELEQYKKNHSLKIEWPKGQTLKLKQEISATSLTFAIKGSKHWFEYEGQVQIDQDQVLEMRKLLDLLNHSHGRFVKLADGEFIALTDSFKKQLQELKTASEENKINYLGSGILRELAEEAGEVTYDTVWQSHIDKLGAMEKHYPKVPTTLQTQLREYQESGFSYLSRFAKWGIGVCLADDMGLGKTVQAIALLLEQASLGPALVIAPTSVCFNWLEELAKFAPTLTAFNLATSQDRQATIDVLTKRDVLICSYHLLHQLGESLAEKTWQTIILDEAQAIKNVGTKRWQSATKLTAHFRLALTGTPIENHLGELWSIFRFLNPGLLGSLQSFQKKFSSPIEKNRDPVAKRTLKNLVSPYILRRIKSEVLTELPAKTEQSIFIEPSSEEIAFYESVRIKALEKIKQLNEDNTKENNKRFSILAEITRLRQACCHSSLVDENIEIESSKIKLFIELVKNLIENHHKVLVFSQYVRYLGKIKIILEKEHISYQYLDGATPLKARQASVEAFQSGEGDVFLISLKAGGTGLNLTAADYVIILDPWWNPAVEDQASDRAHRIGQQRPVTVYKLIVKGSIEEKMIQLHQDKKDLAEDLLSGGDMSGKMTEEELIQLINF